MVHIKSKDRVRDLAEVYTNVREVRAMLDLVPFKKPEDIIGYKYLEPACGNGNFLNEIMLRKLHGVNVKYADDSLTTYEFFTAKAVSSIYGIDICPENVVEARERLFRLVKSNFDLHMGGYISSIGFYELIEYILEQNIVVGDSINKPDEICLMEFKPKGKQFERRLYCYSDLVLNKPEAIEVHPFENFLKIGISQYNERNQRHFEFV